MSAHEPMFDRDGEECRFCGKSWHLVKPGEDCPHAPRTRRPPEGPNRDELDLCYMSIETLKAQVARLESENAALRK